MTGALPRSQEVSCRHSGPTPTIHKRREEQTGPPFRHPRSAPGGCISTFVSSPVAAASTLWRPVWPLFSTGTHSLRRRAGLDSLGTRLRHGRISGLLPSTAHPCWSVRLSPAHTAHARRAPREYWAAHPQQQIWSNPPQGFDFVAVAQKPQSILSELEAVEGSLSRDGEGGREATAVPSLHRALTSDALPSYLTAKGFLLLCLFSHPRASPSKGASAQISADGDLWAWARFQVQVDDFWVKRAGRLGNDVPAGQEHLNGVGGSGEPVVPVGVSDTDSR